MSLDHDVILRGRVMKITERTTTTGKLIVEIGLAIYAGKTEGNYNPSMWMNITCFREVADEAARLQKGQTIQVFGSASYSSWQKDGEKKEKWNIIANKIEIIERNKPAYNQTPKPVPKSNYTDETPWGDDDSF